VLVGLCVVLAREFVETRGARAVLLDVHRWGGLLALGLAAWRLRLRWLTAPLLDVLPERSACARSLARTVHAILYGLLLAVPLLGWCFSSADGQHATFFGLPLPHLVAADEDVADRLHRWHVGLAWTFLALIALHTAAACWHQFFRREPILRAMWPWGKTRGACAPEPSINNRGDTP
jgi:cytochrome b561